MSGIHSCPRSDPPAFIGGFSSVTEGGDSDQDRDNDLIFLSIHYGHFFCAVYQITYLMAQSILRPYSPLLPRKFTVL